MNSSTSEAVISLFPTVILDKIRAESDLIPLYARDSEGKVVQHQEQ